MAEPHPIPTKNVLNLIADTPHIRKTSNHPPHILEKDEKTLSLSAFIPFCSFIGNWSLTGVMTDKFSVPVCSIFTEVLLEGRLCYQADVNKLKKQVDWEKEKDKIVSSGFMFMLDYSEDRHIQLGLKDTMIKDKMVDSTILGHNYGKAEDEQAMVYIETVGK